MERTSEIKVSVVVPVYNVERLLPRCLDSLLGQTLEEIEIVCVNDASPDSSAEVLARYAASDNRLRIITKTVNEGPMMARKTGYENARGQYFCFCDSDDYMPPEALSDLYRLATATGADIAVGEMNLENDSGRHVTRPRQHVAGANADNYLKAILNWTTCSLCGSLFRRSLFDHTDYETFMRHSFSDDRLVLTQLLTLKNPSVAVTGSPTYYYCLNHASITRKPLTEKALTEQLKALFWCYDYVKASREDLDKDNRNFIIRYLSLYLEKGAPAAIMLKAHADAATLLGFNEMKRVTSTRFAMHTAMCLHSPLYRKAATAGRLLIRRLQGKD